MPAGRLVQERLEAGVVVTGLGNPRRKSFFINRPAPHLGEPHPERNPVAITGANRARRCGQKRIPSFRQVVTQTRGAGMFDRRIQRATG